MKIKSSYILPVLFCAIIFGLCIYNVPIVFDIFHSELMDSKNNKDDKKVSERIEDDFLESVNGKNGFINLHGAFRRAMGSRYVNETVRLNNGWLSYKYKRVKLKKRQEPMKKLNEFLSENGCELLYVAVPIKNDENNSQLPAWMEDYSNENQTEVVDIVRGEGIPVLDLRETITEAFPNRYDAFFFTDHHWKPEAGFWAYTEIADYLTNEYDLVPDERSMDLDNYNVEILENHFLGSQGKKVGEYFCEKGLDDFAVITPKFDTDMVVDIPKHKWHRVGTYKDVFFYEPRFKKDPFTINTYASYIGGDYPLVIQRNENAMNKKKCLILKDSFSLVIQPYFSFLFDEVNVIDLRYFDEQTLCEFVKENNIDICIMLYSNSVVTNDKAFAFGFS